MAATRQTHAKRSRELALKERRERKRAKKAEAVARRAAAKAPMGDDGGSAHVEPETETATSEWIR